ncbi:MAG: hypothetical protein WBG92_24940, partial [Thiohalocapsa sp.]
RSGRDGLFAGTNGAECNPRSFRPADDGPKESLLPHGNPCLDCRNVDAVLGEFLVDALKLRAVPFILRPPEHQGNLSAFAD